MPPAATVLLVPASVSPFDAMNGISSSSLVVSERLRLAAGEPLNDLLGPHWQARLPGTLGFAYEEADEW
jgi:hypothetical protein